MEEISENIIEYQNEMGENNYDLSQSQNNIEDSSKNLTSSQNYIEDNSENLTQSQNFIEDNSENLTQSQNYIEDDSENMILSQNIQEDNVEHLSQSQNNIEHNSENLNQSQNKRENLRQLKNRMEEPIDGTKNNSEDENSEMAVNQFLEVEIKAENGNSKDNEVYVREDLYSEECKGKSGSEDDIVMSLLNKRFIKRSEEDMKQILNKGRPTPILSSIQVDNLKNRNFKTSWYDRYNWLCGSRVKNSLFCWPCLLFSAKKNAFTTNGFQDWKNLSRNLERHNLAKEHIKNIISMKELSNQAFTILEQMNKAIKDKPKVDYNAKVAKNRELFKRIVDLTCLLCKQELSFRGHDESDDSLNRGNYREIFDVMMNCNEELKAHWKTLGAFSGTSKTTQNDLIECIKEEMEFAAYDNIKSAHFFSIQVDETTDITENSQCSIIARFVDKNGLIKEHLLGFHEMGGNRNVEYLYQLLMRVLEKFDFKNKLIGQTFDGASVMSYDLNGLQAQIRTHAPQAMFTHSCAHRLNLVLQHSCRNIKPVKIFFSFLQGIPDFFNKSSHRSSVLDQIVGKKIATNNEVMWIANAKIVNSIFCERNNLINVFEELINSNSSSYETVRQSEFYKYQLSGFSFVFYLYIFKDIFLKMQIFSSILHKKSIDIQVCINQVSNCLGFLQEMRTDQRLQEYVEKTQAELRKEPPPTPNDNEWQMNVSSLFYKYQNSYFEILDNIITQIDIRYSSVDSLSFLQLADSSQFDKFRQRFPEEALHTLMSIYGNFFDRSALINELKSIYDNEKMFFNSEIEIILKKMIENELCTTLPQAYKMFCLIATLPVIPATVEKNSSCLKRIKTCARNMMCHERLSSLGFISIEKELLVDLMHKPVWYENVINRYTSKKHRRIELLYK